MSPLTSWVSFYVITGSSAGALIGLMFVVITLIASARGQSSNQQIAVFGTPTIVHFCVALFVSATVSAPWPALWPAGVVLGITGAGGLVYTVIVVRRARRQTDYQPVLEDWLFHAMFPLLAYGALVVAATALPGDPMPALFGVAAVTLLLLFIGIHNSWDTVTFVVVEILPRRGEGKD
jgi:hypothetical protein